MSPEETKARYAVISKLALGYPSVRLEPEHLDVYVADTSTIPLPLLERACDLAARKSPVFFPSRPLIEKAARKLAAREVPTPNEAWEWVVANLADSGRGRDGSRYELADRAVGIMGGWDQLGQKPVAQRNWTRKEFLAVYRTLFAREADQVADDVLGLGPGRREPERIAAPVLGVVRGIGKPIP